MEYLNYQYQKLDDCCDNAWAADALVAGGYFSPLRFDAGGSLGSVRFVVVSYAVVFGLEKIQLKKNALI